ncbi:MAG TPA: radical SAM protein [Terriglobales bacterium]|nr:radical SAM protein [Terriglobales bacterium]
MTAAGKAFARKVASGRAGLWKGGRPRLARLDLELTERCNNDCLHCSVNLPAGDAEARRRELDTAGVRAVLEAAAGLGCLSVRFTGGEPLLREDFETIYLDARRLGLRVRLFTNAALVTPRLAALLERTPPLERVEVSVYGMTMASAAAATRNAGSYDASRRGIGLLAAHGVPFAVKGAVLPPTKDETDRLEAWAKEVTGLDEPPSHAALFDLRSRRDDKAKNERIRRFRLSAAEYLRLAARRGGGRIAELRRFVARFAGPAGDRLFMCLADSAAVDAYGRFQVCLSLRHPRTVYDLNRGSLEAAVKEFLPEVREMRATDPAYLERCGRCFLKALCLQCPAKSWAEHGTLETPVEYFCGIAHAEAASVGVLEPGEKAWTVEDWPARVGRLAAKPNTSEGSGAAAAACEGE